MKIAKIFFLLILLSANCFSQNYFLHLDSLPPQGVALDKGWKFHEGDDTAWAAADYDDSKWQTVNLSNPESYFPAFNKQAIGWFRIKIYVDSSTNNNQAAILLSHLGASDWFINGRLFIQFGRIISRGKVENYNPHDKPILFPGNLSDSVIIAVRFASIATTRPWLFTTTHALPITIKISPWMNALSSYKAALLQPRMQIGFSFMTAGLGFLFILLFTFFPKERVNLLFGIFCLAIGFIPALNSQLSEGSLNVNSYGWISLASEVINKSCGMLVLAILSLEILNKITIYTWSVIVYVLVIHTLLNIFFGQSHFVFIAGLIGRLILAAELFRLSVLAVSRGNYLISIVGFGGSFVNVSAIISYYTVFHIAEWYYFFNSFLSFAIITIYLAIKYARNSRYLTYQLSEINRLSGEKQQLLTTQKERLEKEVVERTSKLNQSLKDLKETQSQLIQSEKMASLGELTAGIAHEIQNPLNFVNNFSEVSMELADDLKEELTKIEIKPEDKENLETIANDLIQNQEKINHHGKRAEGIVKGMLHHSRTSTGQKELTDINLLADEYLRLSYHGLRAKDKSFNATLRTDFDEKIGKVSIVPQDIGRVFLNLFNNAFYSVTEKKEAKTHKQPGYEPTVAVTTRLVPGSQASGNSDAKEKMVEIRVWDNGMGVSQAITDKIYQPFFTTKPTGKGTGLGLSLSYDIILKEHGGQITLETKDGEYAEFIIRIPALS